MTTALGFTGATVPLVAELLSPADALAAPPPTALERAWYAVHDLPNNSRGIALLLHHLGIGGRRGEARDCPLGNYLRWRVPGLGLAPVAIDLDVVDLGDQGWFPLPDSGYAFVRDFDEGCYPTLIQHPALPAPAPAPVPSSWRSRC
jgi:hypothetical protein